MQTSFRLVFTKYEYFILAIVISIASFFTLSILSEYIFLDPYLVFSVYTETAFNFLLVLILSILAGIVVSMNIFRVKLAKKSKSVGASLTGTIIGASAGVCSCGPIGFSVITTFGTAGSIASSFLTNYETPLRLLSVGILVLVVVTTMKSLSVDCKINQ